MSLEVVHYITYKGGIYMSKAIIFLANGVEEVEFVGTVDILRRGNVEVTLCAIDELEVVTGKGIRVVADIHIDKIVDNDYDLLILPGGAGVKALDNSSKVKEIVRKFDSQKKYVSAICAAPLILGKMGLLNKRKFTCFPSFEEFGKNGIYMPVGVVQDEHIITGRGVGYVYEFALHLLEVLEGKKVRDEVSEKTLITEEKSKI